MVEQSNPIEQAWALRQQGLSNNQIVEAMQRAGYQTQQILDSLNQADLREQTRQPFNQTGDQMQGNNPQNQPGAPGVPMGPPPTGMAFQDQSGGQVPMTSMPDDPNSGLNDYSAGTDDRVEELVEAIIDEKWKDVADNLNRIIDWKEKTEVRITEIETKLQGMKDDFDKLHTAILEKVGEYDKHIMDVGTEVQALEKVFQKVLPGFIENVSELSRITDKLRKV